MPLTPAEKAAARSFRDDAQARLDQLNRTYPPDFTVPHFLASLRHECWGRDRTAALDLREIYQTSPDFEVLGSDTSWLVLPREVVSVVDWPQGIEGGHVTVAAGRFGFFYREGVCRDCGSSARSDRGRLVLAEERPPLRREQGHARDGT